MSTSTCPCLIWLDPQINKHDQQHRLKDDFSTDSPSITSTIPYLLAAEFQNNSCLNTSNAVEIVVFNDKTACLEYLQRNRFRRTFLIVSGSLGVDYSQQVFTEHSNALQESLREQRLSIYVLCTDIESTSEGYGALIFSDERTLMTEVMFAIGDYFEGLGKKQYQYGTLQSTYEALRYLSAAKTLFLRADDFRRSGIINVRWLTLDGLIHQVEDTLRRYLNERDEIDSSIAAGDTIIRSGVTMVEWSEPTEVTTVQKKNTDVRVILLQSSFPIEAFPPTASKLKQLIGDALIIVPANENYHQLTKRFDSPIFILSLSNSEGQRMLDELTSVSHPPMIYLLSSEPTDATKREVFFRKYHSVCAMCDDLQELIVRVAVDVAMMNRILGDRYARENKKDCAEKTYDRCINGLNRLDELAKQNRAP